MYVVCWDYCVSVCYVMVLASVIVLAFVLVLTYVMLLTCVMVLACSIVCNTNSHSCGVSRYEFTFAWITRPECPKVQRTKSQVA